MGAIQPPTRRRTAIVTLCSLLLSPAGLVPGAPAAALTAAAGQGTTTAKPAAAPVAKPAQTPAKPAPTTAKPATAAAAPAAPDGEWPRRFTTASGAAVTLHQPQVASWENQKLITFYAAASYSAKEGDKPALGTIKAEADTKVSVPERLVDFSIVRVTESNFPTLAKPQVQEVVAEITKDIPQHARVIALDRVLGSVDKSQIIPKNVEGVKADPPVVFFSKTPAVIVNIDGDPVWSPITGSDLKYAVNTNWDLFELATAKTFYLRHNATWLKATSLDGAWTPAGTLPDSFKKLPADDNWAEVKAAIPGTKLAASAAPKVFLSTKPAELILLTREPNYLLVGGTSLLWVSNTDSDVFRLGKTGTVYYLVAGRWFSAPDFTGPWTFATQNLPPDFQKIPLEHERSRVLASVPGTDQAAEAVLLASIPQTARVDKKSVKAPDVNYDGEPQFQPIEQTSVSRAVNTDKDIIKVGDLYYMCFQGVWFMSKAAAGPWEVTGEVPKQIYEIPVSSPSHSVTYVTVEDNSDDWVVYASAAAYTGVMVAWGCAVWGTGYYYPPYVYGGIYRPYYPTYGYSAWYNPWTGSYGRGAAVYGPYGGAGVGARYNPATGTYARGAAAYGPYGGAAVGSGIQLANGYLRARRRRRRTLRRAWRSRSLQPAHRRLWGHASGLRRLRQLGPDRRHARRRLGDDVARHQSRDRHDDASDAGERRWLSGHSQYSWRGWVLRRAERQRRCLRRARRQRLSETGRQLAEVRQRQLEQRTGNSGAAAGRTGSRVAGRLTVARSGVDFQRRFSDRRPAQSRFGGAQQRRAAHARLRQRSQRRRRLTLGQLPAERRHVARRRWPAAVMAG